MSIVILYLPSHAVYNCSFLASKNILNNILFKFDTYVKMTYRPQLSFKKCHFMKKCSKIYIHEATGISRQIEIEF